MGLADRTDARGKIRNTHHIARTSHLEAFASVLAAVISGTRTTGAGRCGVPGKFGSVGRALQRLGIEGPAERGTTLPCLAFRPAGSPRCVWVVGPAILGAVEVAWTHRCLGLATLGGRAIRCGALFGVEVGHRDAIGRATEGPVRCIRASVGCAAPRHIVTRLLRRAERQIDRGGVDAVGGRALEVATDLLTAQVVRAGRAIAIDPGVALLEAILATVKAQTRSGIAAITGSTIAHRAEDLISIRDMELASRALEAGAVDRREAAGGIIAAIEIASRVDRFPSSSRRTLVRVAARSADAAVSYIASLSGTNRRFSSYWVHL